MRFFKKKKKKLSLDNVFIGKGTNINGTFKFRASKYSKIKIGKYCAIANGCKIITLNHDYNFPAIQGKFHNYFFDKGHPGEINQPPNIERSKGDVIIGNDVWIGEDVFITSGIQIGNGCCIGAKSVVTKNLDSYSIYAGIPAKFIKKRYPQNVIDFLEELKWWDWDDKKIRSNEKFFYTNLNNIEDINHVSIN